MTAARTRSTTLLAALLLLGACATPTASPSPVPSAPSATEASTVAPSAEPSTGAGATPTPGASAGESQAPAPTTYTVRAGDTLFSIARAWGTSVAQLQAWNADRYPSLATDPDTLEAGWVIVVSGDPGATPLPTPATTPTAQPTPPPTPVASGCSAGNRVAAGSPQTFYTVPNAGHALALTLDMGGRLDPGVDILNFLIGEGVCVTIFPTGAMAQTAEGQKIMAIVKAHPELFEVGNHTMHHCDLVRGGGGSPTTAPCAGGPPSPDFIRSELTDAEAIIRQYSGQNPQPYWRAPYGSLSDGVRSAAASVGYTKTFQWDIDTIDWKPISDGGPTAQQIATKVITNAQDGSIVLMHLGGYETLQALKLMVPGLRDRGFTLTSLSDLLR